MGHASLKEIRNQVSAALGQKREGPPRSEQAEEEGSWRQVKGYGLYFLLKGLWACRGSTLDSKKLQNYTVQNRTYIFFYN